MHPGNNAEHKEPMLGAESQFKLERANFEILLHIPDLRGSPHSNGVLGLELPFS